MKDKNSIIVVVSGMIIVLAIVLLGALSNSNTDNTNKAPSPITPLFKPKEPSVATWVKQGILVGVPPPKTTITAPAGIIVPAGKVCLKP